MKFNYFKNIENKYRTQLSRKKPLIIRLDGHNVTKNPDMKFMGDNTFTKSLAKAGEDIIKVFNDCKVYVALDEISFIFTNPSEFFERYDDCNTTDCSNLFLLDFVKLFWNYYYGTNFGVSIFNINSDKIESYIKYRQKSAYNTAIFYYAKRYIPKKYYVGKSLNDVVQYLKENDLLKNIEKDDVFLNGKLIQYKDFLDDKMCIMYN